MFVGLSTQLKSYCPFNRPQPFTLTDYRSISSPVHLILALVVNVDPKRVLCFSINGRSRSNK